MRKLMQLGVNLSQFGLELAVIGFAAGSFPFLAPVAAVAVFSLVGGRFSSSAASSAASASSYSVSSLNEVTSCTLASLVSLKIDFIPI